MTTPLKSAAACWSRRAVVAASVALLAACTHAPISAPKTSAADAAPVRVMTSGGFTEAHKLLAPQFSKATGIPVESAYGSSMGASPTSIPNRLQKGEVADVVILARSALDDLADKGLVQPGSQVDLVKSGIGVSVKNGSPLPDISTEAQLREALLAAKSIAYSASASGVYYETELLKKLGIHDQVMPKSRKIVTERVGTIVARGEAELGLQQVSELLPIEGISFVGPLPESVQKYTVFSAGTAKTSINTQGLRQLLQFYTSPTAARTIRDTGLEPISK